MQISAAISQSFLFGNTCGESAQEKSDQVCSELTEATRSGTVTDADLVTFFYVYCDSKTRTYGNICISGPRMVNGGADNVIVFVYTDCVTQQPLGPESQNPA